MYSGSKSGGDSWVSMAFRAAVTSGMVVTMAVALRLAGPPVVWFLATEIPRAYDSALAWLRPPYLYLVINGIIICIAASSHFQKQPSSVTADQHAPMRHLPTMDPPQVAEAPEYEAKVAEDAPATEEICGRAKTEAKDKEVLVQEEEEEFVISRSSWSPKRWRPSDEEISVQRPPTAAEKPLITARFSSRKISKSSPEGKALGVARRPRRNETLESTWRTITEGRAVPLARHLKKSDTWDALAGREDAPVPVVRKSETFNERGSAASPGSEGSSAGRLRREASLGHDELNRRVEAFIKKFNEEMRLQRQESLKHYKEMVNRDRH